MNPNSDQGLRAARQGRDIHKHITEDTVTSSFVVQTAAAIYFDIPAGKQVVVVSLHIGCDDANEFAATYLVGCSATAGGGDPTQFHAEIHDHVGDKKQGHGHIDDEVYPPVVLKYSDGHRSVSMAVKATDTNTVVDYGWTGWVEDEGTLS
jgi:hypothetical protein